MKNCCTFLIASAFVFPLFAQPSLPVRFHSSVEFFPENFSKVCQSPDIAADEIVNGYYMRYLQCAQIPNAAERAAVESEGVQFFGYVQFGAYLVGLPQFFDLKKLEKIHARSIVPVKNEWKMAKSLHEQPYGEWAIHDDLLDVNIQVYPHISIAQGAEFCRRYGMTVLLEGNQNGFLQVRLLKESLDAVAAFPWVRSLELVPPPSEPDDTRGRALHRSNALDNDHPLGKKYNGEGVSVLVRDDGPLGPHIDYRGRLYNMVESDSDGTHGDGVGGILGGAGNLSPTVKGMAAGANIYAIRYTPEFQDQTLPLHLNQNVTITNSSYSNGCNVGYTLASQTVDQQIFEHPTLMHVFSAGNSNNITTCLSYGAGNQWGNITGGHKMAKNAIATANLFADASLVNSSSRGPAYDGRLKPDISANGEDQVSTDPDNTYTPFGGTSGAAPGIAGCLAQLTHAYKMLHNGQQPPSALLKAMMLNTANDLGNTGPDFKFGWGHVNAWRALRLLEENRWLSGLADQGEQPVHTIQIPANARQARIMLYWADPPAAVEAEKALLNDLDLTLLDPNGTLHLPWKLDPTPDPNILNTPAGRGRDSLNNTEQIVINNPAPGTYTVQIGGTEVPLGAQAYFMVWEFLTDDVKLVYPIGGEGFVPGETERIYWDASGNQGLFSLRYSMDDGFSWQQIADIPGDKRVYDWQVPNVVGGRVRLLIQRGLQSHTTELPLSIAPLPKDIQVEQVCPNSMTISWKPAADTLPSDIYLLGKKYMEIVGTAAGNTFTLPLQNGGTEQWVSARARNATGLAGRRATAVSWPGELKNCVQPDDLGVRALESPTDAASIRCEGFALPVTVFLKNEGTNPISGAILSYQVNNDPIVSQAVPIIAPGASASFTFQKPISIAENRRINLKTWSTYTAEDAFFNDTLRRTFIAIAKPASGYFSENFEGSEFPPFGWHVTNPDESSTWSKTAQNVTGANSQPTRAVFINNFFYLTPGAEDFFDMIPLDLSNTPHPGLTFQVAHAQGGVNDVDQLRVEVYPACDLNVQPSIVWQKSDPALATAGVLGNSFSPNGAEDWRTEIVNLQPFAGQKVIIRFVNRNGTGNNIFLDNIGIVEYAATHPVAAFTALPDSLCVGDTVTFAGVPTGGNFTNYEWVFGPLSQPSSANGIGPHKVKYFTSGTKSVRFIAWNTLGRDTLTEEIHVLGSPIANFSAQLNGLSAIFTNTSQNALSYSWDFGDGTASTLPNPVHIYALPGSYIVKLSAANQCKTVIKSLTIPLTSGVNDLADHFGIRILPNPTTGDFKVEIEARADGGDVRLSLFDTQGRLAKEVETTVQQGTTTISFENLGLPKGMYQLTVQTGIGWQAFSVVVQ